MSARGSSCMRAFVYARVCDISAYARVCSGWSLVPECMCFVRAYVYGLYPCACAHAQSHGMENPSSLRPTESAKTRNTPLRHWGPAGRRPHGGQRRHPSTRSRAGTTPWWRGHEFPKKNRLPISKHYQYPFVSRLACPSYALRYLAP